jgi:hypothetical protein
VTAASELAGQILRLLPDVKRGSLVVYGDIFGGRIDNMHRVTSAHAIAETDRLIVEFNEGETLEISDPRDASISSREFRIASASRVRWEWFYYGRPKTAENRFFIEHVRTQDTVVVSTNPSRTGSTFAPTVEAPAVELVGIS